LSVIRFRSRARFVQPLTVLRHAKGGNGNPNPTLVQLSVEVLDP